jgi:hypothetical protein
MAFSITWLGANMFIIFDHLEGKGGIAILLLPQLGKVVVDWGANPYQIFPRVLLI